MRSHNVFSVWLCFEFYLFLSAGCTYTSINTKQHQVVFHYSDQHRSEKNLPICDETSVCSVLHKRYWLPPVADRLCRCGNNDECPWRWSNDSDNYTMILNNRSQFKFCSPVHTLKQCRPKESALTVQTDSGISAKPTKTVHAKCFCSKAHYWKHFKTISHINAINGTTDIKEEFKCAKLKKCDTLEFCGNVRTDHNSIFYRCSCPEEHLCVVRDKTLHKAEEVLYKGSAYRAVCEPYETNSFYDY